MNPLAGTTRFLTERIRGAGYVADLLARTAVCLPRLPRRLRFLLDNSFGHIHLFGGILVGEPT